MNTLIVIDSADYDRNLVNYGEKFLTSDHDHLHFVYVIEVNQTLEIDAQMEIEIEKGERSLGFVENITSIPKNRVHAELLQTRHKGAAIVNEITRKDIRLLILGSVYPEQYGVFKLNEYLMFVLKNAYCDVLLWRSIPSKVTSDNN